MKNPDCAMTQHAFDITSEFPPDAGRIAEMRLAASASRKEVDRRAGIVARATWFGMAISGTAAAGAMGLSIASSVEAPGATADIAGWLAIMAVLAALLAFISIQGLGGFYVAAGETGTSGGEAGLDELDADRHPLLCIEFVRMCEVSETVRRYQNRLAAMGRRPVVAEVEAARQWAGDRARQRLSDAAAAQARRACNQLSGAV